MNPWWIKLFTAAALIAILGAYARMERRLFLPACGEPDTAAYFALAERMAAGEPPAQTERDPFRKQEHTWVETPQGELVAKYPPGYPALMAAGLRLGGETGAYLASPIMGGLTLVAAWLLFGLWMSRPLGLLAVLMLALNPMFVFYTSYPLAHAAEVCFVTWGMYFLWNWVRTPRSGAGLAAGLCLGFSVLVRPTSLLYGLALLPALATGADRARREGRRWIRPALALLIGYGACLVVQAGYNFALFGHPLKTGYASMVTPAFAQAATHFRANRARSRGPISTITSATWSGPCRTACRCSSPWGWSAYWRCGDGEND